MWLLLRLSLRNLLRQKRRNILLGSAMAIGVGLLVTANSFSNGLTDIMMNKILRWVTGHVSVTFYERGRMLAQSFADPDAVAFISKEFPDVVLENEEAVGTMVRAVGNGKSDNMILVGVNIDPNQKMDEKARRELEESFRLVEGKWDDLNDPGIENPVILSADKAKYLNVKPHDVLRLRMRNIYGQDQSARVTVVGTMKTGNIFMGPVTFGNLKQVKALLGYSEHAIGSLSLTLKDPGKNARAVADAIHARLKNPGLAVIAGSAEAAGRRQNVTMLGFNSDPALLPKLAAQVELTAGSLEETRLKKRALVAEPLARALALRPGGTFEVRYTDKWGKPTGAATVHVGGLFKPGKHWSGNTVLLQDDRFYEAFYSHWPQPAAQVPGAFVPSGDHPAYALLAPEWILLPRTYTTEALTKKMKELTKKKWRATVVEVGTMYETAEQILKLQGVLNLITLSAVLVLFFIILIGVVNTLRMTIRERTREIGTIRAIGMRRADVRNIFVLETLLLAFFASVAGVLLALLTMGGLSHMTLHMGDNPMGMFLVNSRLYFLPAAGGIVGNMALIMILAGVTAYFPARRAANLPPSVALRHIE